jgi:hypothetical protein
VARTARRVRERERKGQARVGRRERGARSVFIERGRGEERSSGRERKRRSGLFKAPLMASTSMGESGEGETVELKLHYSKEKNGRGWRAVGRAGLGPSGSVAGRRPGSAGLG